MCSPENVEHHTRACIVLHNYFICNDKTHYAGRGYSDHIKSNGSLVNGGWRNEQFNFFKDLPSKTGMNYSRDAKDVRDSFKTYFNSPEGSVPWQDDIVDYDGFDETA